LVIGTIAIAASLYIVGELKAGEGHGEQVIGWRLAYPESICFGNCIVSETSTASALDKDTTRIPTTL
jgi:hypothetical protein